MCVCRALMRVREILFMSVCSQRPSSTSQAVGRTSCGLGDLPVLTISQVTLSVSVFACVCGDLHYCGLMYCLPNMLRVDYPISTNDMGLSLQKCVYANRSYTNGKYKKKEEEVLSEIVRSRNYFTYFKFYQTMYIIEQYIN